MNPVPPLIGIVAIALGVWGGLQLGAWAAPDSTPAVSTIDGGGTGFEPVEEVSGSDPESFYHAGPLEEQLTNALRKVPEGTTVSYVGITPARFYFNKVGGPNVLAMEDLPVEAPERILEGINAVREEKGHEPVTLDDVTSYGWSTANPTSVEWSIDLESDTRGPTSFSANRDGSRVQVR